MTEKKTENSCSNEVIKLQQHLQLLKGEYVKLQTHYSELQKKYAVACINSGNGDETSFVSRLLDVISSCYDNALYSDLSVKLLDKTIHGHKLIFIARSNSWGNENLSAVDSLDWAEMDPDVASALVRWIYTDQVDFSKGEDFTLQLMKEANSFKLDDLVVKCEKALMALVTVKNCVRFYSTADEIKAETLKQHCSSLISTHWEDFTSDDFEHMPAVLLYEMFKSKTKYVLHSAIRLRRDDVVFLYLVENNLQLSKCLNQLDNKGQLPLELALKDGQTSIARTLLEHNADPDAKDTQGWTLLHRAIARGDDLASHFLIEHGANVSIRTPEGGDTALHLISSYSPDTTSDNIITAMTSVASVLLDRGLDANLQNNQGFTALHLSIMARYRDLFDLLLSKDGVDLNSVTLEGHTPLYYALISTNDVNDVDSFASKLVDKGAQPNPIYRGKSESLLHYVTNDGLEEAALFICTRATNLNHTNQRGESALHLACEKGLVGLVNELLRCGCNPNITTLPPDTIGALEDDLIAPYRLTPLLTAILNRQDEVVKAMLNYNQWVSEGNTDGMLVNLNLKDSRGDCALSLAVETDMQHLIRDLIDAGADINIRNGEGLTLLHQAIIKGDADTALFLLSQGANMDTRTQDGLSPLQLAIKHGVSPVVDALCKGGVDMSVLDSDGNYPLWIALTTHQEDIATILVRHGVDTDCWGDGPDGCLQTLLHKAIDDNNQTIAKFLIQSGCDLDSPRRPGIGGRGGEEAFDLQSPLHLCCQWGLELVAQTLLEYGANVNSKDAEGKTPLHVAVYNQHHGIVNLLLCHPLIDVTQRDKTGLTPFATALTCRNNKAAQAILQKLPTAAEQIDHKGRNFLHMAIQKVDIVSVLDLLAINVDVNSRVQDSNQTPPLHLAAATGNEMLVRNLILAQARVNDKDSHNRTALHVASEAGHTAVVAALIQNNIDFDAIDDAGDNALHLACKEGHSNVVRELLVECSITADAMNLKGQTPLHVLSKYAKDSTAASICDLFMELMESYPVDKADLDGNTALLLAYMKGSGNLCRSLVKAGACVAAMNKQMVTVFNYPVATTQLLTSMLNSLSKEPPWAGGVECQECTTKFNISMRKHHCRHCGRLLCSKCASCDIPIIKYNLNKPVRVCDICFEVLRGV